VGKAGSVFQRMRPIWTSSTISSSTKTWLYSAIVVSIVTYACETWKMTARIAQKLNVFHQRCLRKILQVTYKDHITNEEILRRTCSRKLADIVTERRFRMAGHVLRLPSSRPARGAITWTPAGGARRRGRPRMTWRRTFQQDLERVGITWQEVENTAKDQLKWRQAAARCAEMHGRN